MGNATQHMLGWTAQEFRLLTREYVGVEPIELIFPFGGIVLIATIALTLASGHDASGGAGFTLAAVLETLENSLRMINLSA